MNAKQGAVVVLQHLTFRYLGGFWTFSFQFSKCNGYTPTEQKLLSPLIENMHPNALLDNKFPLLLVPLAGGLKTWLPYTRKPMLSTYQLDILT